ncbi:helix-turn-helix domain-containing protein [Chryseobacterium chendengshani]|uniref:helix-turn-helix transcriptional regulator n=1 Tax=Chryseobacterium sp. LJ668 TaxID=2864040 RepID=UPI001C690BA2|nr:helix-turn-helix transcriptional regulator [Chryseobacterium sp. LJ668]MBW8522589.1 helix-turn-helix domain-containing protein [Chryseobacterium sp. LJ668]QYK16126.1 helix-turn-helix domain-containing protein [Chryseobacterium sp. LJ668]
MSLNERISKVIEYSKLSSSEFADEIDVQRSSISHITSGRNKPSLEFIIKIKSRFPEILWDWLVNGDGEMLKSDLPEIGDIPESENLEEKTKPTSLPDLFTMINDDEDFGSEEENIEEITVVRESAISHQSKAEEKISNSQPLEKSSEQIINQVIENQTNKIKRIVLFYDNGKFESFEP